MRYGPPIGFARKASGSTIAYQVLGAGPIDLVYLHGWPTHIGLMWENPQFAEFLHRLSSFSRLILFDRIGNGMSDRGATGQRFEDWIDDIRTVLAAVGSERAALFGCHLGGRLALMFAASHPDQTSAVVTFAGHPATLRDDDYPWGTTFEERQWLIDGIRSGSFDLEELLGVLAPGEADDPVMRRWWTVFWHSATSVSETLDEIHAMGPVDIRALLGSVRVPTLLLHRIDDRMSRVEATRYMAERLPNATLKELPGGDHFPFFGDQETVAALVQEFLTGSIPVREPDRVVLTVMFTDIVDSTAMATRLGDRRWERLLAEHHEVVRSALARYRGNEVETTGDGFLATFDGPARAIRAAAVVHSELAEHGLRIRVGLHTGECELADGHVQGIAVHIAARVVAQATAGEILCSRTVKDLVAGAGFRFTDRGTHRLKGVADEWQLFAAEAR